jgi:hypothetical protein
MQTKAGHQGQNGNGVNGNGAAEEEGFEEDEDDEFTAMREVRIYVGEEQCECKRFDSSFNLSIIQSHTTWLPRSPPS